MFQGVSGGCQDEGVVGWVELGPCRHVTRKFQGVSGGVPR